MGFRVLHKKASTHAWARQEPNLSFSDLRSTTLPLHQSRPYLLAGDNVNQLADASFFLF